VKAILLPLDQDVPKIYFMFNPSELTFECAVETKDSPGSRTEKEGQPKPSFSYVDAEKITINKILFDTYESGENVVNKYIQAFRSAVQFVGSADQLSSSPNASAGAATTAPRGESNSNQNFSPNSTEATPKPLEESKRTPIYRFVWGSQVYLRRCFIAKLNYKLTLFLPNGTPVRAVIDSLVLKKADEEKPSTDLKQAIVDRVKYNLQAKLQGSARLKM